MTRTGVKDFWLWLGAAAAAVLFLCLLLWALVLWRPAIVRLWLEKSLAPPQGAASIGAVELNLFP
ncbi:MAG: hypothetical protein PVG60_04300, partial [Desulfarculaceae bacterium]